MLAVAEKTVIRYGATCADPVCQDLAGRIFTQLNVPKYSRGVSVLPVPASVDEWRAEHRTARKRADRSARLGYRFDRVDNSQHTDAIHEINTSKQERQGRPMSSGYLEKRAHGRLPDYACDRHYLRTYGVLRDDVLRAYLTLYRLGDLALVSMILGHGEHLRNDVMYLLFQGVVEDQASRGGVLFYNRHDSGTDGLRFYKERLGFRSGDVDWVLQ